MSEQHFSVPVDPGVQGGHLLSGRYRLVRLLGSGGMAQVWEAQDEVLGRRVAVKLLHAHLLRDAVFVQRFRNEAIAAARLAHPAIVAVYDTCSGEDHEAIVLELVEGTTLRRYLDQHRVLEPALVVRIGVQVADALAAAHAAGLVHRDIKPANILLCPEGRVKVADFGIAKADDQTDLTRDGNLIGTATYLAPEQLQGAVVDGRTDLYSLAIVLYECLTGRPPFTGDTGAAVALARLHTAPLDPRRVRASVPRGLAEVLMRTLSREPAGRYPDAMSLRAALIDGLERDGGIHLDDPAPEVEEAPEDPDTVEAAFPRSERRWLLPALAILLLAAGLTVAGILLNRSLQGVVAGDTDTATTVTPGPPAPAGPLPYDIATYDPQGDGAENDRFLGRITDGDRTTLWRSEGYDSPSFFGTKSGVGLILTLEQRSLLEEIVVTSPTRGWTAELYLPETMEGFDPTGAEPVARIAAEDTVGGDVAVALGDRVGRDVLIWFTSLGPDSEDPERFRVAVQVITVTGSPLNGD